MIWSVKLQKCDCYSILAVLYEWPVSCTFKPWHCEIDIKRIADVVWSVELQECNCYSILAILYERPVLCTFKPWHCEIEIERIAISFVYHIIYTWYSCVVLDGNGHWGIFLGIGGTPGCDLNPINTGVWEMFGFVWNERNLILIDREVKCEVKRL